MVRGEGRKFLKPILSRKSGTPWWSRQETPEPGTLFHVGQKTVEEGGGVQTSTQWAPGAVAPPVLPPIPHNAQ